MSIQPIYLKLGPNWPNRQCCLAGSSQRAPRILIFLIVMGADYSFYVKTIDTHARTFLPLNISAIGTVGRTHFLYYLSRSLQKGFHRISYSFCFSHLFDLVPTTDLNCRSRYKKACNLKLRKFINSRCLATFHSSGFPKSPG